MGQSCKIAQNTRNLSNGTPKKGVFLFPETIVLTTCAPDPLNSALAQGMQTHALEP